MNLRLSLPALLLALLLPLSLFAKCPITPNGRLVVRAPAGNLQVDTTGTDSVDIEVSNRQVTVQETCRKETVDISATAPASIGFQKQTDIGTSGRLTGTGTMEFNGGTGNAVTIPVNSVALPSPYDPASTFLHLGALELNSPGSTGTLTSNGGSRGGSSTLTVTGTTSVTDFGLHLTGGTTKLQGTTTIGAGMVMSGSVLELHAATALNASINIDTGSVDIASGSTLTMAANTRINAAGAGVKVELSSSEFGALVNVVISRERLSELDLHPGDAVYVFPKRVRVFVQDYSI